jgi:hypothetical protein
MFGIDDPGIWGAYFLCVLSTLMCVAYGILNWDKGAEREDREIVEEMEWESREKKLEEEAG